MRLKRLEISGFKSFADKTALEFHPGITAVVGPNGCGKSNIADAFRWVLGEQSAKSLRGGKMQDVLFAGTTKRKALNVSEVTITLTDIAGALPIDYDEVSITRRLYRDGESEYLINRNLVRLKDIQELFLDSGLGKQAFSIFEQGKMDQVIHYSPVDRRVIFEEAAGIGRFLMRKKEALRKLEQVEQNVTRAKDIFSEVERQISLLERQAEKARLYKDNKSEFDALQKALLIARFEVSEKKRVVASEKEVFQVEKLEETRQKLADLQALLGSGKATLSELEKRFRKQQEELFSLRNQRELKSKESLTSRERVQEIEAREKELLQELGKLQKKKEERTQEVTKAEALKSSLEKTLQEQEALAKAERSKTKDLEESLLKLRLQQKNAQQERFRWIQEESRAESELKQTRVRHENAEEKLLLAKGRKDQSEKDVEELSRQVEERKAHAKTITEAIDQAKQAIGDVDREIAELTQETLTLQRAANALLHEDAEHKARQKVLLRMREDHAGFSLGSKKILQDKSLKVRGLYEFFVGDADAALTAVLRPYAQTLVVETKQDLEQLLQSGHKDFSVLCLESLEAAGEKVSRSLLNRFEDNVVARHFLQEIYEAESLEDAIAGSFIPPAAYLDKRGVLFFQTQTENSVFGREAEIKTLEKKLKQNDVARAASDDKLQALQQLRLQLQEKRNGCDKAMRSEEMRLVEATYSLQRFQSDRERLQREAKQLDSELAAFKANIETLALAEKSLLKKHEEAKSRAEELLQKSGDSESELEKLLVKAHEQKQLQMDKEHDQRRAHEEFQKLKHVLSLHEVKAQESEIQERRFDQEVASGRSNCERLQLLGGESLKVAEEAEKRVAILEAEGSQLELLTTTERKKLEASEQEFFQTQEALQKMESERYQTGVQLTQHSATCRSLEEELLERHQLSIAECSTIAPLTLSFEQADRKLKSLRNLLEEAGDINMASIEECETHKSRHAFLSEQLQDLTNCRDELMKVIDSLDGESRKLFQETFEMVARNFKKNFQVLFSGGEADLQLTESKDVLQAGIEIIAKPPGKQMRSISLMSGGEKCLTAMALLFAIFEVKPAPFCLLDEMDAPLDDSNVERFLNVVRQFQERCQFIIITHNKRTMAMADILFGVSMQERGVSKILQMEFSREVAV